MAPKRLIVNADELGRTASINEGILRAHREGIVTSATLIVSYPAAGEVRRLSAQAPQMGIGLHVQLTGGQSVSPPEKIPSLVNAAGALPERAEGLSAASDGDVLAEVRAQLRRFRDIMGRDPTHFDSHHHAHRIPAVLEALLTLSWETGLPVRAASPAVGERLRREGIKTTDRLVDGFAGDAATEEALLRVLKDVGAGSTELMCHPDRVDTELRSGHSYVDRELAVLASPVLRHTLQATGVRLIHFGQL
jgi:chitin disaccharide deacetylase